MIIKYLNPRHHCWWCKEMFEETDLIRDKSRWLCKQCYSYLKTKG